MAGGSLGGFSGLYDSGNSSGQANAAGAIQAIMPYNSVYYGSTAAKLGDQITAPAPSHASQGALPAFLGKVASIGSEVGHIVSGAASWIGKEAVQAVEAPVKLGYYAYNTGKDLVQMYDIQHQQEAQQQHLQSLMNDYKSGRLTGKAYDDAIKQLLKDMGDTSSQFQNNQSKLNNDRQKGIGADVNFEGDIVAALTGGLAKPIEAAADPAIGAATKFLTGEGSKAGDAMYQASQKMAQVLDRVPGLGAKPSTIATQAVQNITNETVQTASSSLTSTQLAKSVASSLLIKKPLVYNQLAGMGAETYKELEQGKYGSAIQNIALFSGMALAGGPIGWAMDRIKGVGSLLKGAVFGQTTFMDALSQRIGDGNAQGLYNFLSKPDNGDMARSFKAMEATNLQATGGNVQEAVNRIANWYEQENGITLQSMTHEQIATDLHTTYTDQQAVKAALIKAGYTEEEAGRAAVGRWSIQDNKQLQGQLLHADQLAEQQAVTNGTDAMATKLEGRRAVIQQLQDQYGRNAAWLNSDTLQNQLDTIFQAHESTQDMLRAIDAIDAQSELSIDKATQDMLRNNGHIAIIPEKGQKYVSFEETNGKIASQYAVRGTGGAYPSYFEKASSPLPVLGTVGTILTRLGMSPDAANSALQESFRANLGEELAKGNFTFGGDKAEIADSILRSLSDFAKNPVGEGQVVSTIRKAVPITDYRQMTLDEIKIATGTDTAGAKQIRDALMTAMLKVPLEIRGLGDKIMDVNYKYNPLSRQYARIQGAGRYIWNPFFQWQKTTQTEFMAQMEAGGKFLT